MITTICPIVRTERTALSRMINIDGLGRRGAALFEQEVLWLRECSAQVIYRHGGQVLSTDTTYSDFYGFLTSIDGAVESAMERALKFQVDLASTLEIAVVATVTEQPVLRRIEQNGSMGGRPSYDPVPNDWKLLEPQGHPGDRLTMITIGTDDVWSSYLEVAASRRKIEAFKQRFRPA